MGFSTNDKNMKRLLPIFLACVSCSLNSPALLNQDQQKTIDDGFCHWPADVVLNQTSIKGVDVIDTVSITENTGCPANIKTDKVSCAVNYTVQKNIVTATTKCNVFVGDSASAPVEVTGETKFIESSQKHLYAFATTLNCASEKCGEVEKMFNQADASAEAKDPLKIWGTAFAFDTNKVVKAAQTGVNEDSLDAQSKAFRTAVSITRNLTGVTPKTVVKTKLSQHQLEHIVDFDKCQWAADTNAIFIDKGNGWVRREGFPTKCFRDLDRGTADTDTATVICTAKNEIVKTTGNDEVTANVNCKTTHVAAGVSEHTNYDAQIKFIATTDTLFAYEFKMNCSGDNCAKYEEKYTTVKTWDGEGKPANWDAAVPQNLFGSTFVLNKDRARQTGNIILDGKNSDGSTNIDEYLFIRAKYLIFEVLDQQP